MDRRRNALLALVLVVVLLVGLLVGLLISRSDDSKVNASTASSASDTTSTSTTSESESTSTTSTRKPSTTDTTNTTATTAPRTDPRIISSTTEPVVCTTPTSTTDVFIHWKTEDATRMRILQPGASAPSEVSADMTTYQTPFDCGLSDPQSYVLTPVNAAGVEGQPFTLKVSRATQ